MFNRNKELEKELEKNELVTAKLLDAIELASVSGLDMGVAQICEMDLLFRNGKMLSVTWYSHGPSLRTLRYDGRPLPIKNKDALALFDSLLKRANAESEKTLDRMLSEL